MDQLKKYFMWLDNLFKIKKPIPLILVDTGYPEKVKFSCPQPNGKPCDRHKINDEEGRWEFCNTCQREWAR